jgi:hypothetical protein
MVTKSIEELRREARVLFPSSPAITGFGGLVRRRIMEWMTKTELERVISDGALPLASSYVKGVDVFRADTFLYRDPERDGEIITITRTELLDRTITKAVEEAVPADDKLTGGDKVESLGDGKEGEIMSDANDVAQLAQLLLKVTGGGAKQLDESRVRELVELAFAKAESEGRFGARQLVVSVNDAPGVEVGIQHREFDVLLQLIAARIPVYMVGAAGSGKTSAAGAVADALGLPFWSMSLGQQTSKSDLLGYCVPGTGEYKPSCVRLAYEGGGVVLLDEMDSASAASMTALNAILANGRVTFPDGETVHRHADFVVIAAANTFGQGADRQYVGRNQLDAATLDRFFFLEWGYDRALMGALVGAKPKGAYPARVKSAHGLTAQQWHDYVCACMDVVASSKLRHVVSPRALIYGATMIQGFSEWTFSREELLQGLIYRGCSEDVRRAIDSGAKL